jgi:hypothetical protein
METTRSSSKTFSVAFGLALTMVVTSSLTPGDLAAQCSGCKTIQGAEACGEPTPDPDCSGSYQGKCSDCYFFYASVPAHLTPDGALLVLKSEAVDAVAQEMAEELAPGVTVLRSACNGVITERYFTEEAASRARRLTARLVFE